MRYSQIIFCISLLGLIAGCSASSPPPTTQQNYASSRDICLQEADKKLGLFDRPDTYPISDEEKNNARLALFSQCMNGPNNQIASTTVPTPQAVSARELGALSPAAGGTHAAAAPSANAPANIYNTPSGTVIVLEPQNAQALNAKDVSGLAALSPSSGGKAISQDNPAYPGATVVVVQGAPSIAPQPVQPAYRPALPVAIPVPVPPSAAAKTPAVAVASSTQPAAKPALAHPAPPQASDPATQELERVLTQ